MQRQTFVLHAEAELSYREIADTLGISIGTVMSRLFYAGNGSNDPGTLDECDDRPARPNWKPSPELLAAFADGD